MVREAPEGIFVGKGLFRGIRFKENPDVMYPPKIVNDGLEIIPESAAKLREAIIKNLGKPQAG